MKRRSLAALILVNAVMLAALVVATLTPPAQAQFGGGGNYMMISGQTRGRSNQNAVYIINLQTSQIVALMFNSANDRFEYISGRRIIDDANAGGGR